MPKKSLKTIAPAAIALAFASPALASFQAINVIGRYASIEPTNPAGLFAYYSEANSIAQTFSVWLPLQLDAIDLRHNPSQASFSQLTISFYKLGSNDSPVGELLGQLTTTPTGPLSHIDLSSLKVNLSPEVNYSFILSSGTSKDQPNMVTFDSGYFSAYDIVSDAYPEGLMWTNSSGSWTPFTSMFSANKIGISDVVFSLYGTPTSVPEPGQTTLITIGLIALALRTSKRF